MNASSSPVSRWKPGNVGVYYNRNTRDASRDVVINPRLRRSCCVVMRSFTFSYVYYFRQEFPRVNECLASEQVNPRALWLGYYYAVHTNMFAPSFQLEY